MKVEWCTIVPWHAPLGGPFECKCDIVQGRVKWVGGGWWAVCWLARREGSNVYGFASL